MNPLEEGPSRAAGSAAAALYPVSSTQYRYNFSVSRQSSR